MQNDIFNNRPLFYSEQFDYNSNFLLDFKKFNLKLDKTYLKYVVTDKQFEDILKLQLSKYEPRYCKFIEGVTCLYTPPRFENRRTNIAELKNTINQVLIENLSNIKNEKVLLMLSGGIDSQMILHYCLELGIDFTALYITSDKTRAEKDYIQNQSILKKFKLIVMERDIIWNKMTNEYATKNSNPPFHTMYFFGNLFYYTLLKHFDFDFNIITGGFEAEVALDQIYQTLYRPDTTKETFVNWNNQYGCYMSYSFDAEIKEIMGKLFSFDQKKRLEYRITQNRDYAGLEKLTGKLFYTPFKDSRLLECAVNLSDEEKIENAYKKPNFELLQQNFNFTVNYAGNFKDPNNLVTFNNIDREGTAISNHYHREWIKNYLSRS